MEDSLSIVFAIILSLILMFMFPLIDSWDLQDNLSYTVAYAATVDFVDTARNVGYISRELYDNYESKLSATGNTYDISMEHRRFDEDIANYLNTYTNEIIEKIDETDSLGGLAKYKLDKYDYFYVTVKNTNKTQASAMNSIIANDNSNFKMGCAYGGVVWSIRDE